MYISESNIKCSSINITNNECCRYSAIGCFPFLIKRVSTCRIIYASIVNNSAKGEYGCIALCDTYSKASISTSNIINNKQDDKTNCATIIVGSTIIITESCIIGNNEGNKVFWESSSSCQIKITNCTLDSDIMTNSRYLGSVTIIRSKEYSFINSLSHIVTGKCESFFDSYGDLTVSINIPRRTSGYSSITRYLKCTKQYNIQELMR